MKDKVESAISIIKRALTGARRPAVMCSFGKDSIVVLHLTRKVADLPVIFHREPFMPHKYRFANSVIDKWNLTVYDYPPCETALQRNNKTGAMEVINAYHIGGGRTCLLPTGIIEPNEGKPYLCGFGDLLHKPTGTWRYPFDIVIHGHKSSDVDPILGAVPLNVDIVKNEDCASAAFPLKDWTDEDVWEYTLAEGIPIHKERYNRDNGWKEHEDTTSNPDYFPACMACLNPDGPDVVSCPKMGGKPIPNMSSCVRWTEPFRPSYIATT